MKIIKIWGIFYYKGQSESCHHSNPIHKVLRQFVVELVMKT